MKDFNGCSNLNHSTCVGLLQLLFFDSLVDVLSHKPSRARVCACVRVCLSVCVRARGCFVVVTLLFCFVWPLAIERVLFSSPPPPSSSPLLWTERGGFGG